MYIQSHVTRKSVQSFISKDIHVFTHCLHAASPLAPPGRFSNHDRDGIENGTKQSGFNERKQYLRTRVLHFVNFSCRSLQNVNLLLACIAGGSSFIGRKFENLFLTRVPLARASSKFLPTKKIRPINKPAPALLANIGRLTLVRRLYVNVREE